jgi:DNA (cytosine-5)-methyltransferase 1
VPSSRGENLVPISFDLAQVTSAANRTRVGPELPASTLNTKGQMHVSVFNWQSGGDARGLDPKPTAQLQRCQVPAVAFDAYNQDVSDVAHTLRRGTGASGDAIPQTYTNSAVRRLTARECERLQGFPDDYTMIPWRNKSADQCPDGPRYKALGNSMAVLVMAFVGQRIQMVQDLTL